MVDKYEDPFVRIASMIGGDEYLKVARSLLKAEDATDEVAVRDHPGLNTRPPSRTFLGGGRVCSG